MEADLRKFLEWQCIEGRHDVVVASVLRKEFEKMQGWHVSPKELARAMEQQGFPRKKCWVDKVSHSCFVGLQLAWTDADIQEIERHRRNILESPCVHAAVYGPVHPFSALPDVPSKPKKFLQGTANMEATPPPPIRLMTDEEYEDHKLESRAEFERSYIEVLRAHKSFCKAL